MTEYANEFRMIAAETEYDEGTLTRLLLGGMLKKLQDAWEAGETDNLNTTLAITRWAIAKENKHSMMDHIREGRPTGKFDTTPRTVNGTFRPTPVSENRGDPMELDATRRRPGFNISAKEYQRRMRANLCLTCAKPGHREAPCRSQANNKEGATWEAKTDNKKQWRPAAKAREMEVETGTEEESGNDESPE